MKAGLLCGFVLFCFLIIHFFIFLSILKPIPHNRDEHYSHDLGLDKK